MYIYIIEVNYAIYRIYEKAFRSVDELLTTNYFFLLFICTW